MNVHWTDRAKWRLGLIKEYIAEDSPDTAKKIVRRILVRSKQIGELPYSGRRVPEYEQEELREILGRPYRIIYRIKDGQIDVVAVIHYRQLLPADIKTL